MFRKKNELHSATEAGGAAVLSHVFSEDSVADVVENTKIRLNIHTQARFFMFTEKLWKIWYEAAIHVTQMLFHPVMRLHWLCLDFIYMGIGRLQVRLYGSFNKGLN